MLTRVTITGADDDVDQQSLHYLSKRYPFVEWGILLSSSKAGTPRYPSEAYINALPWSSSLIRLSAHLCGAFARSAMAGEPCIGNWPTKFHRFQINGFLPTEGLKQFADAHPWGEIICQVRDEAAIHHGAIFANSLSSASLLYDPSGGRGVETHRWPWQPADVVMGYAGGISPDNVVDVIRGIEMSNLISSVVQYPTWWIDMESGVRTDDKLDLAKVEAVLAACEPFIAGAEDVAHARNNASFRKTLREGVVSLPADPNKHVMFPGLGPEKHDGQDD